jgi:hypothetical protein
MSKAKVTILLQDQLLRTLCVLKGGFIILSKEKNQHALGVWQSAAVDPSLMKVWASALNHFLQK